MVRWYKSIFTYIRSRRSQVENQNNHRQIFFSFQSLINRTSLQTFSLLHTNKRALEGSLAVRTLIVVVVVGSVSRRLPKSKSDNNVFSQSGAVHRRCDLLLPSRSQQTSRVERVERVILAKVVAPADGKFRAYRRGWNIIFHSGGWRIIGELV